MPTKFRELEQILRADGWQYESATGSHYKYVHPTKGSIRVPFHGSNATIAPGTLNAILKQAGVEMMRVTTTVEQAEDGSWTAAVIGKDMVLGTGPTREAALDNLRAGVADLIAELRAKGERLPESTIEVVNLDVAA